MSDMRTWIRMVESQSNAAKFIAAWKANPVANVVVHLKQIDDYKVELLSIEVSPQLRRQGLGTQALDRLTALADDIGVTIVLYPEPSALDRLVPYYERFGFVSYDGGNSMVYND